MPSVFLCHALEDSGVAAELKKFLEAGTCYEIDAAPLPEGESVATWFDHGGADAVVLLLSPRAVPVQARLEDWQPVLDELDKGVLATLMVTPCRKPQRLERRNHFGAGNYRGVKNWLLATLSRGPRMGAAPSPHPSFRAEESEALRCVVSDRAGRARLGGPGGTLAAIDFAHRFHEDFERVVWSHCGDGTPEGALSDLAMRLQLRLSGPLEKDVEAIEQHVAGRRYLLILDSPPSELLADTGKSSLMVTGSVDGHYHYEHEYAYERPQVDSEALDAISRLPAGCTAELARVDYAECRSLFESGLLLDCGSGRFWSPLRRPEALTLSDAQRILGHLTKRRDPEDLGNAQAALRRLLRDPLTEETWRAVAALQSAACSVARDAGRIAEVHALVSLVEPIARQRGDMQTQRNCAREKQWIEEQWGLAPRSVVQEEDPRDRQFTLEL